MSISLTEMAFNLVRAIDNNKSAAVTSWEAANYISENGSGWQSESVATTKLAEDDIMPTGNIANIYADNDNLLPADLASLVDYCTRISRLEETVLTTAVTAVDYMSFTDADDFMKFHKGLRTLKERLDTTIRSSADSLVNTVASYVKGEYDAMASSLPVNVTDAEVQQIAAGIAETFAEDFAAKIQEKLNEITNNPE